MRYRSPRNGGCKTLFAVGSTPGACCIYHNPDVAKEHAERLNEDASSDHYRVIKLKYSEPVSVQKKMEVRWI